MTKLAGKWVADSAIDTGQLAADAVEAAKIATAAVDTDEIAADAVGQSEIDQSLDLALTGTIDVSGGTLKAGTPSGATEVSNKQYVDTVAVGLKWKDSVRARGAVNVDISSAPKSIDGVVMVNGDRVLLDQQSTGTEDGIYIYDAKGNPMTRSADAQTGEAFAGVAVMVEEGNNYGDRPYVCINDAGSDVVGTNPLTFSLFIAEPAAHQLGGPKHEADTWANFKSKITDANALRDDYANIQYMHKVTAGEVTAGYLTLPSNPSPNNFAGVMVDVVAGTRQVNKQAVGATGVTPDFDILSTNQLHINNNGAATGLSGDIVADDVLIINYTRSEV
jgi:stage V sporulation protein SpoVS